MTATTAQIQANRLNAARSTGPKTVEGKEISRRNSLKHGFSGDGIVFLEEQTAEVDRLTAALTRQLKPTQELSERLVERIAVLSIRVSHCAEQETLLMVAQGEQAALDFDDDRLDQVEILFDSLPATPSSSLRRLGRSAAGVQRLIDAWKNLRLELETRKWKVAHAHRAANLQGFRPDDCHALDLADATEAILSENEQAGTTNRADWGREQIQAIIQSELDHLTLALDTFDDDEVDRQRQVVVSLARFSPTPETILVRKYEAAAERNLYRALREARFIEAAPTLREQAGQDAPTESRATDVPETTSGSLASFVPEPDANPDVDPDPSNEQENSAMTLFFARLAQAKADVIAREGQNGWTLTATHRDE